MNRDETRNISRDSWESTKHDAYLKARAASDAQILREQIERVKQLHHLQQPTTPITWTEWLFMLVLGLLVFIAGTFAGYWLCRAWG